MAAPASCPPGYFCGYAGSDYSNLVFRFKDCCLQRIAARTGGSWYDNQSRGTKARMYNGNKQFVYETPGAPFGDTHGDWTGIRCIDACWSPHAPALRYGAAGPAPEPGAVALMACQVRGDVGRMAPQEGRLAVPGPGRQHSPVTVDGGNALGGFREPGRVRRPLPRPSARRSSRSRGPAR